jgi:hypothetical protein
VWQDIYVATEKGGLLCITMCACARVTTKEKGTYTVMHKFYHNNFSANKQNHDAQTCEQRGSALLTTNQKTSYFDKLDINPLDVYLWNTLITYCTKVNIWEELLDCVQSAVAEMRTIQEVLQSAQHLWMLCAEPCIENNGDHFQ